MLDPSTCSRIRERVEENPENKSCWAMLVQSGKGGGGGAGGRAVEVPITYNADIL